MSYHYPIDLDWSKEEIIDVVEFFNMIEKAYESKAPKEDILIAYQKFKRIIPSKGEEKQLLSQFEKESGYSGYHVVKKARETNKISVRMK